MSGSTYRSSGSGAYRATARVGPHPARQPDPDPRGRGRRQGAATPGARKRRRDPLWARLFVVIGALLMMGSGGVIAGGKVLLGQATASVNQQSLLGEAGVAPGRMADIEGPINMLLIGLDYRANGQQDLVRSDTIVILHVPASHDQAYLISLPRDTRVKIPDYPKNNFKGWTTKINAAFAYGHQGPGTEDEKRARGVELLAKTIKDLAGIQFTGAAIIDFAGFEAVLHELGGVDICVDQPAQSIHLAENKEGKLQRVWYDEARGQVRDVLPGYHPVRYTPGCQRLSPEKALDYSRIRKGLLNGDYDRQRHQQELLRAIAKEATSKGMLADPLKLKRVLDAAGKAFTLDTQRIPIADFLFTLKGVTTNDLTMVKTNAGKFNPAPDDPSEELLSADSMKMLHAVRDGKMVEFLIQHPEFISPAT